MGMFEFINIDVVVLALYFFVCICIGLYRAGRVKTLKVFAVGEVGLPSSILVMAILASAFGAGSFIGYSEKIYIFGTIYAICVLFHSLFWLVTAWVFARNIGKFSGCLSISEVMYRLYGLPGRWVTSITALFFGIGILAAHATAIGYIFHYFFGVNISTGIILSYGILTFYSALGGIRAVVLTEILQFAIFFFIIPTSVAYTLNQIGGIEKLMQTLPPADWGLKFSFDNIPFAASLIFFILLPNNLAPAVQRYLMASSPEVLSKSLKIIALITLPIQISICIIAYIVKVYGVGFDPADTFIYYIDNFLPIGIKSLMITGIIAILMAVAESYLNTCSVILVNDVIKVLNPKISNAKQMIALRASVCLMSALSAIVAINQLGILKLVFLVQNFWTPLILIPISAGFLGFSTSSKAFVASVATAMTFTLISRFCSGEFDTISISFGILGSAIGLFGMHYWQRAFEIALSKSHLKKYTQYATFISLIKKSTKELIKSLTRLSITPFANTNFSKTSYFPFAGFVLVYYFIYTLCLTSDPADKVLFYLLVIGYLLCLILLLKDILFSEAFQNKFLPTYWYLTLTFCVPLVSSYMLFASSGDDFWIINALLSAFSLYFFANYIIFATSLSLGVIAGYILFIFADLEPAVHENNPIMSMGYVYLFFLFTSLFFMRNKEKGQSEQLEIMQMVGASIAHEVKTPIATMSMCANALSELLKGTIVNQNKDDSYFFTLNKNEYELLNTATDSMQKLSKKSVTTADNILITLRTSVVANDKKRYLLSDCIQETLNEYAAYNDKVKDISVSINKQIQIYCSLHYFKHMIFNLLKNAYKYNGHNVKIKVWNQGRNLHFKDYGNGIDGDDLPHIFKRFYTKDETGTGIGLAFCRMVMEDLGGSIKCISEAGKYTEFILYFPATDIN